MAWLGFDSAVSSATRSEVSAWLQRHGVPAQTCAHLPPASGEPGLLLVHEAEAGEPLVRQASAHSRVLVIVMNAKRPSNDALWQLLDAGALDVLWWPQLPPDASGVQARLARHADLQALIDSPRVTQQLVGRSTAWRQLLAHVVELARFSHSPVLIQGESGTGKELIARLIHDLDEQHHTGHLVVDCTTLTPELSGSELFGHERGAFTGALNAREGAFAQAHMGTLFLDEVGDLPLPLQAQLLRVVQEKQYKRVGGNAWQQTDFRLVAATHRDLQAAVDAGSFRADLYYRIAGVVCRTPALAERREDVLPLAEHFQAEYGNATAGFDDSVKQYLSNRPYPGNVRDLRRVVTWLCQRHAGQGPITLGAVPLDERPTRSAHTMNRLEQLLEELAHEALAAGLGLKAIAAKASEAAIRCAVASESGNLQRAAQRLGVTDRALQLRRAQQLNGAAPADEA